MKWIKKNEALLTIILASCALAVSFKGCVDSEKAVEYAKKAYELAEQQNKEEKLLILNASINNEDQSYKLTPANKKMLLQEVEVFYPKDLGNLSWHTKTPRFRVPTAQLNNILIEKAILETSKKLAKEKGIVALYKGSVPVAITSSYVVKGSRLVDQSLYSLSYESILGSKDAVRPKLAFTGFSFVRRVNANKSAQNTIDKQWHTIQEHSREFLSNTK